jgi:hypothetical protein
MSNLREIFFSAASAEESSKDNAQAILIYRLQEMPNLKNKT